MKAVGLGAHADISCRDAGTNDDLPEVFVRNNSFGCHKRLEV